MARLKIGRNAVPEALSRYDSSRKDRTARVQIGSRGNEWLKEGGNADAWSAPL